MITDKCFQALKMWKIGSGSNWHTSIQSDQNHCTQGDLPRFIRNFYEECRGPPRLFLLDKFDVAGAAGACLKRYTDPSFFKMEWAKSELMKAQHTQLNKKANIEKVKSIFAAVKFLSFLTFVSIHWLRIFTRDHNTAPLL
jgi:hypothetical protein